MYHDKKEIILKAGIPVAAALLLLLIFGIFLKKRRDKNAIDKGYKLWFSHDIFFMCSHV